MVCNRWRFPRKCSIIDFRLVVTTPLPLGNLSSKFWTNQHMFQLSRFERKAPVLKWQLPSSCFFLKSPVFRWFWLECQIFMNFKSIMLFNNSMWKFWLLVMKLGAWVALATTFIMSSGSVPESAGNEFENQ